MSARVSILHPEFSWHTPPTTKQLQKRLSTAPTAPRLRSEAPFWLQRIVGIIHQRIIIRLSVWYCQCYGLPVTGQIWPLPFGLTIQMVGRDADRGGCDDTSCVRRGDSVPEDRYLWRSPNPSSRVSVNSDDTIAWNDPFWLTMGVVHA